MAWDASRDVVLRADQTEIQLNARLSGATWSMKYRGVELIAPQPGNGGSMQSACSFDVPPGDTPEKENPTEAGNVNDSVGITSSRWLECNRLGPSAVSTRCQMAYFYPPGRPVESANPRVPPRNQTVLSRVYLDKYIAFGWGGLPDAIDYRVTFLLPPDEHHWFCQFEALCGYAHMENLLDRWVVGNDGSLRQLPDEETYSQGPTSPPEGCIFCSKDGSIAHGVCCVSSPKTGANVYSTEPGAKPWPWLRVGGKGEWKWNYVQHAGTQVADRSVHIGSEPREYRFVLVNGNFQRVADVLKRAVKIDL